MFVHSRCRRCTLEHAVEASRVVVALPEGKNGRPAQVLVSCPSCGTTSLLQVPRPVAAAVMTQGAASLSLLDVSALCRPHPESPPADAPPLTHDDLLDLHQQLAADPPTRGDSWPRR